MRTTQDLPADVIAAIHAGRTIEAIKLLRAARGLGLKEAKHAVDAYILANPSLERPRTSNNGLVFIIVLVLLGFAVYRLVK